MRQPYWSAACRIGLRSSIVKYGNSRDVYKLLCSQAQFGSPQPLRLVRKSALCESIIIFDCDLTIRFQTRYIQTRTHYYFRYEGSTPEPPCVEGVHWRVLKDPVTVAPSQINELQSLLANRIDPDTCQPYTAARVEPDGSVHANRPLQRTRPSHLVVYCECVDWDPNLNTDKEYCNLSPEERGVVTRTKRPTEAPATANPTVFLTPPPSHVPGLCECPTDESTYLCNLFQFVYPSSPAACI